MQDKPTLAIVNRILYQFPRVVYSGNAHDGILHLSIHVHAEPEGGGVGAFVIQDPDFRGGTIRQFERAGKVREVWRRFIPST